MKLFTMKRAALLCAGVGAVGLVGTFAFTGTSALYTSQAQGQTSTITSGTVTLDNQGSIQLSLPHNLVPGDTFGGNRYALHYTGTSAAFVGVDVTVTSTSAVACPSAGTVGGTADLTNCTATGQSPLFDGTGQSGLSVSMVYPSNNNPGNPPAPDANASVTTNQLRTAATCTVLPGNLVQCVSTVKNVLVATGNPAWNPNVPGTYANGGNIIWPANSNISRIWVSVYGTLDLSASNASQGSTTTVDLAGHAVQADNNTGSFGASTCAAGTNAPMYGSYQSPTVLAALPCPKSWS